MTDEEYKAFEAYVRERADKAVYAGGLKGIPGKDKHHEEADIAQKVLEYLGLKPIRLQPEPGGPDTLPDIAAHLPDGTCMGIEVTELVSGEMRALQAKRRAAERKLGLDPLEALRAEDEAFLAAKQAASAARAAGSDDDDVFWTTYREKHPTPDHISATAFVNWDADGVAKALDAILRKKDRAPHGGPYNAILLAIFTDEMAITSKTVAKAKLNLTYRPTQIQRAFMVRGYNPEIKGYPVIELWD